MSIGLGKPSAFSSPCMQFPILRNTLCWVTIKYSLSVKQSKLSTEKTNSAEQKLCIMHIIAYAQHRGGTSEVLE